MPGFAREIPAARLGLARRGFVAGHDAGRGLTRHGCDRVPGLEVGLSTTVPLLSSSPLPKRFEQQQWAAENAEGLGRHLAQWLLASGETVLDVPTTATARVRKTDTLDAAAAASVAVLHGDARPAAAGGTATVLRVLDERRTNLTRRRTRTSTRCAPCCANYSLVGHLPT